MQVELSIIYPARDTFFDLFSKIPFHSNSQSTHTRIRHVKEKTPSSPRILQTYEDVLFFQNKTLPIKIYVKHTHAHE